MTDSFNVTLQEAVAHHQAGRVTEAERGYLAVLQDYSQHPDANHNLGVLLAQAGRHAEAIPYLNAALEADPAQGQYWLSYAETLLAAGQAVEAQMVMQTALQSGLDTPESHALLRRAEDAMQRFADKAEENAELAVEECESPGGNSLRKQVKSEKPVVARKGGAGKWKKDPLALAEMEHLAVMFNSGRYAELEGRARKLVERHPGSGVAWKALGVALLKQGKASLPALQKAATLLPEDAEAHKNLGMALQGSERYTEAAASFRRVLKFAPDDADMHANLGHSLWKLLELDEAVASYRRAVEIRPGYAEAHNNLGLILDEMKQWKEAEESYCRALELKPDFAMAYYNLAITLCAMGRLAEAEGCYREALRLDQGFARAYNNLGILLISLGRQEEAKESFQHALEVDPDFVTAHSNLIFVLDLIFDADKAELFRERCRWDEVHAAPLWREPEHDNDPSPDRRLRVGYVSADFWMHSAPRVFGGMLVGYDRAQFEVFAYSNSKGKEDYIADLFRRNVTAWRDISALSDEAVAEQIRADGIDILVDLSGHSANNRLLVFARKPAPVQVTAWGYATGTGLRAMDAFFTDPVMVPPQERQYFREEVRYLPSAVTLFSPDPYPEVNELPALHLGQVTFGSFNRLAKITEETWCAWGKVLRAVPNSRLLLKTAELDDPAVQEAVKERFVRAGGDVERLELMGKTPRYEHVQAYGRVDIALDSFPHGGGVTVMEGLAMGVPAVTLRWPAVAGRVSASIMTTLGLPDWIAESEEEYVALAVRKAQDLEALAQLRRVLRTIFMASLIGDARAYVRTVEEEYRKLWQEWCAGILCKNR